jgi:hypothetical protein
VREFGEDTRQLFKRRIALQKGARNRKSPMLAATTFWKKEIAGSRDK